MVRNLADKLSIAKTDLLEMIQSSLQEGRYAEVEVLARIVDTIAGALARDLDQGQSDDASTRQSPTREDVKGISERSPLKLVGHTAQRRNGEGEFPRFLREGDRLVKVGWSKRNRAEYQHKAPREAVDALLKAIIDKVGEETLFEAVDILPVEHPDSGTEFPSYQSYLALAWLQKEHVVEKQGREGYLLIGGQSRIDNIETLWTALPAIGRTKRRKNQ